MNEPKQVCDGWEVQVASATGPVTLHFKARPTEEQVAAALAAYETAQAEANPYQVEAEDGTIV